MTAPRSGARWRGALGGIRLSPMVLSGPHDQGGDRGRAGSSLDPFDEAMIQPSSVDVRVDRRFRVFHNARYPFIDVRAADGGSDRAGRDLRATSHSSSIPASSCSARRSSGCGSPTTSWPGSRARARSGRLGLLIHSTAGFVDPGFEGNLTLELSNVANLPITIYYAMPIGQISFMRMDAPVERPYGSGEAGSKYQGRPSRRPSRFYLNFERNSAGGSAAATIRVRLQCRDANIGPLEVAHRLDHRPDGLRAEAPPGAGTSVGKGIREFRASISRRRRRRRVRRSKPAQIEGAEKPPSPSRARSYTDTSAPEPCPAARGRPKSRRGQLTLVEHLDELRNRIIVSVAVLVVACGLCFWQNHLLLHIVNEPLPGPSEPITFGVTEPFMTTSKISIYAGILIAAAGAPLPGIRVPAAGAEADREAGRCCPS